MDQQNMMYTYNGILLSHKRSEILIPGRQHGCSKHYAYGIRQTLKDKYFMIPLALSTQNSQFHRDRKKNRGHQGLQKEG